jgi:hypothetical protein
MEEGSIRSSITSPLFTSTPLLLEHPSSETEVEKLKRALQSNREYQAAIYDRLLLVNKLVAAATEKKRTLQCKYFRTLPRRAGITLLQLRTTPFFYNSGGEPEDNFDTVIRKKQRGDMPPIEEYTPFAQDERRRLESGIQAQGADRLMRAAKQAHLARMAAGETEQESLTKVNLEMNRIRRLSFVEHVLDSPQIDWEIVANQVRTRTDTACMIEWSGRLDPRINHGKWAKVEDKKLIDLIKEHGDRAWGLISQAMKNRTPMQCLQRYQRSHNSSLLLNKWTPDEDEKLAAAVLRFGDRNWAQVASYLRGRTDQQCLHRYTKTIDKSIKAGRWSLQEDARLCVAVAAYGNKAWSSIQRHVPSRTDVKCRERYMNILNPQISLHPWTPAEDAKLLAYVRAKGIRNLKWTEAAKLLTPRTDNQVWRRWQRIGPPEQVRQYKNLQVCREKTMVRNFVGRRGERPELDVVEVMGPAALTPPPEEGKGGLLVGPLVGGVANAQAEFSYIDCVASLVAQMTPAELQMLHTVMNSKPLLAQATGPSLSSDIFAYPPQGFASPGTIQRSPSSGY